MELLHASWDTRVLADQSSRSRLTLKLGVLEDTKGGDFCTKFLKTTRSKLYTMRSIVVSRVPRTEINSDVLYTSSIRKKTFGFTCERSSDSRKESRIFPPAVTQAPGRKGNTLKVQKSRERVCRATRESLFIFAVVCFFFGNIFYVETWYFFFFLSINRVGIVFRGSICFWGVERTRYF